MPTMYVRLSYLHMGNFFKNCFYEKFIRVENFVRITPIYDENQVILFVSTLVSFGILLIEIKIDLSTLNFDFREHEGRGNV